MYNLQRYRPLDPDKQPLSSEMAGGGEGVFNYLLILIIVLFSLSVG